MFSNANAILTGNLVDHLEPYAGVGVAVLGSTGFIGRHVARQLCQAGARLALPVRDRTAAMELFEAIGIRGNIIETDLGNADQVRSLYADFRPAVTFNLAGYGIDRSEQDAMQADLINKQLINTICKSAAETRDDQWAGLNIVHAGSAMEYGRARGNLDEDSGALPTTLYGRTKLAGTIALSRFCARHDLKGATARLFAVYGPDESRQRLLPTLMEAVGNTDPIPLTSGLHQRDFVYVEESVEALLRLGVAPCKSGAIVNVATGRLRSIRAFVETAAEILGIDGERLGFGLLETRAEEMNHEPVTNRRLRDLTGWTPSVTVAEGIRKTVTAGNRMKQDAAICALAR